MAALRVLLILGFASLASASSIPYNRRCPPPSRRPCFELDFVDECADHRDCHRQNRNNDICCQDVCGMKCTQPVRRCPEFNCSLRCLLDTDRFGCPVCRCVDPCEGRCSKDQECQVVQCFAPPCDPICVDVV